MDTLTKSFGPTKVITANGEVQTHEEATVCVQELDIFLIMTVLENTPAVLSLGKLCDENGYSFEWINGQKPHLIKNRIRIICNAENFVPIVVPGLSTSSSSGSDPVNFKDTFNTGESLFNFFKLVFFTYTKWNSESRTRRSNWEWHLSSDCQLRLTKDRVEPMLIKPMKLSKSPRKDHRKNGKTRYWRIGDTRKILISWNGCQNSEKIWWRSLRVREVSIGKHSVYTNFPKDRNCEICQRTKITRDPCRRRIGGVVLRSEMFGDLIIADHKVLSDSCESRNNHWYAVVVQDLATQWIQAYPCKTKTSQETQRSLQKFLEPERNPEVIKTDSFLEFDTVCEDLSWNHCTSTPHRSKTNEIAERAVRRVKEGTSAALLQSGLSEKWLAGSMECYTYRRNVTVPLSDGKTPLWKTFLGNHFSGPNVPLGSWVEYHLSFRRTSQESINLERKSYLDCSSDTHCTRVEFGRVTYRLQTLRSWRRWSHRKSTRKDSMRKRWYFMKKKGEYIFQSQMDESNPWRRSVLENIHFDTAAINSMTKSPWFFWRIRRVSSTTSILISRCRWSDKWLLVHVRKLHIPPCSIQSQTFLAERRIIPYSTEIHWRIQNCTYEFGY